MYLWRVREWGLGGVSSYSLIDVLLTPNAPLIEVQHLVVAYQGPWHVNICRQKPQEGPPFFRIREFESVDEELEFCLGEAVLTHGNIESWFDEVMLSHARSFGYVID